MNFRTSPLLLLRKWAVPSILLLLLLMNQGANSFFFSGETPRDYKTGDLLKVKVNKLTSLTTQLPKSYYTLPYCHPQNVLDSEENLAKILLGDRIKDSPYEFEMQKYQRCNVVCQLFLSAESAKELREKIRDYYQVNMILDNLPLVVPIKILNPDYSTIYKLGFDVGFIGVYAGSEEEKYFIYNHLAFTIKYHRDMQTDSTRIVGFEVRPSSVKHEYEGEWGKNLRLTTCDPSAKYTVISSGPQEVEDNTEIIFTYDVDFQESDVKWASRWDAYLRMDEDPIHWFSVINSFVIVVFFLGMVAMVIRRLNRDISRYNEFETEEVQEETGWKLVHGDIFRPPTNSDELCVHVGTGVQLFGMMLVTMILAVLGFFPPSNRGGFVTAMLLLWVSMGFFAGYSSVRLHKMFKGKEWKKIALKTALVFPGTVFAIFFVINILFWGQNSNGALPLGTLCALLFLWLGISVPLVFVGSYIGFKKPAAEDPVRTKKIPRQIPKQPWYMNPLFSILIGGIIPFGAVFIEIFFIMTSFWMNQLYSAFSFLFLVFIILIIACAGISIVVCYVQLCKEDYLWWWRSYLTAGSAALYLFLYATFYFLTKLGITSLVSGMYYFGVMLTVSYAFFTLTGTIGFYACFWFTRLLFSSVKID